MMSHFAAVPGSSSRGSLQPARLQGISIPRSRRRRPCSLPMPARRCSRASSSAAWGLSLRIVVLSELPRTRETLLLRVLGTGRLLREALADLAVLPHDAWEKNMGTPRMRYVHSRPLRFMRRNLAQQRPEEQIQPNVLVLVRT